VDQQRGERAGVLDLRIAMDRRADRDLHKVELPQRGAACL
jgi:hypothetical protein